MFEEIQPKQNLGRNVVIFSYTVSIMQWLGELAHLLTLCRNVNLHCARFVRGNVTHFTKLWQTRSIASENCLETLFAVFQEAKCMYVANVSF